MRRLASVVGAFAVVVVSAVAAAELGSTPEAWLVSSSIMVIGIGLLSIDLIRRYLL